MDSAEIRMTSTLELEDNFYTQVMTLNSPMNLRHGNRPVETDPTTSNTLNY